MSFSHVTHHMGRIPETQQSKVIRTTPIIRLGNYGDVVLLQGGRFFYDNGEEVKDLPGWVYGAMERLTPAALKEAGFSELPKAAPGIDTRLIEPTAAKEWTCPVCTKSMPEDNKIPHIAKHNKHLGPNEQMKHDTASLKN